MTHTLRKSVISKIALLLCIPLLLGIGFTIVYFRTNIRSVLLRNEDIVRLTQTQVDHFISHPKDELVSVRDGYQQTMDAEGFALWMDPMMEQFDYLHRVEIVNSQGIIQQVFPHQNNRLGLDISRTPIFQRLRKTPLDVTFGTAFFDPVLNLVTVNIAVPVGDHYIIGFVNFDLLRRTVQSDTYSALNITMVDHTGTYLMNRDHNKVIQREVDHTYSHIINGDIQSKDLVVLNTKRYYIHFHKLDSYNWYLIAYQDYDTLMAPVINTALIVGGGIIVLFGIILLLISITFKSVDKSVGELIHVANQIAAGEYDIEMGDAKYVEFTQLYRNFESMALQIDQRENEIGRLNETIESNYYETIIALAKAIEAKDHYTGNHCERVRDYSMMLGKALNMPESAMRQLRYGSILHDIGKVGIDEAVLNKEGKLSDAEFALIKRHPEMGYDIIKNIKHMRAASDIALYHHERYDGTGYPKQLSGKRIPSLARIVAIADAFDAMTSLRLYRRSVMKIDAALEELEAHAGTQFDPEYVKVFIQIMKRYDDVSSIASSIH